ncbi:hypothetical protein T310_8469 [Rasamsonia emersonii CBS 393.64]|uniref:ERCC4 domain-containing protein n=1 Tax=Rasamsonia emersonii (strain ATCC 16479 / CBS 393.64 / IMI 116815) TaxID=1408163 RepID=A0A0F4YIA1_RASE3|nr:hypothetical protein T310_8469 [Rasamsonia emersonii CBS 393.64]KKA17596.1 hypothetical protein T310_8469 [Rasamsonia emersonii CBS 393.64]
MPERSSPPVKLSLPLQYQQDLFNELRAEDELVILARGLGLLRLVTNLLHSYDAAGNNLVLVVGADDRENEWIGEALAEHYAISKTPLARGLKVINTDRATVPMRVVATALEAFIIRIYRQFNKAGFLKAFSDCPEPFTTGWSPLANMLKNLFLRKPSLWPRFHVTVAESLEGRRKAEVIELEVPMTDKMKEIQNAVLECVEISISELKKANTGLDMEDWTVDSALHKNFDVAIRRQLDPIWHRVSFRTRQIDDCGALSGYSAISLTSRPVRCSPHSAPPGSTRHNYSPWLFLDAAHILFETAKSRVYRGKITGNEASSSSISFSSALQPVLEEQPKWHVLADVLNEIEQDISSDTPTARGQSQSGSLNTTQSRAPPNKRRRVRGGGTGSSATGRTPNTSVQAEIEGPAQVSDLLEDLQPRGVEETLKEEVIVDDLEDMEDYYELYDMNDLVMIHPYDGDMDERILEEARPRYIIMYEPDAAFIRRVEVYRSSHTDRNVRVYFMYYGGSVEEQRYLSAVRREKDAFTKLIKEKGGMAVTLTHDKSQEDPQEQFLRTVNTRIAGGGRLAATAAPPTVVVDVREFRSALPSLLHGRGMVVVPCQLTVGDYVLTPDICVERKSVRDLISSLRNGRLYNQAETMLQHYKNPLLLIEFDQNKSFTFDAFTSASTPGTSFFSDYVFSSSGTPAVALPANSALVNPTSPKSAQHLLVLLTLAFPRLKIIWSGSTSTLPLPPPPPPSHRPGNAVMAAAGIEHRTFNQLPQDMLRAVPGVTPVVLERLIRETSNIHEIANMDVEDLNPLVGRETARKIVRFFRKNVFEDEPEVVEPSNSNS